MRGAEKKQHDGQRGFSLLEKLFHYLILIQIFFK